MIPVSKASTLTLRSVRAGGARWMGLKAVAPMGPRSSTGSPTTFRMRPSTSLPTGIMMPLPRLVTDMPRMSPSVESMAMVRAVFSPRCCATSRTRFSLRSSMPGLVTVSAV